MNLTCLGCGEPVTDFENGRYNDLVDGPICPSCFEKVTMKDFYRPFKRSEIARIMKGVPTKDIPQKIESPIIDPSKPINQEFDVGDTLSYLRTLKNIENQVLYCL
jgi:hypothetical protein